MGQTEAERIRALEVRADNHDVILNRLVEVETQIARYVAAQEERNNINRQARDENHSDRWQVWLRWFINPGLPAGAIILLLLQHFGH